MLIWNKYKEAPQSFIFEVCNFMKYNYYIL